MWVLKNKITGVFIESVNDDRSVKTTDSKIYAAHFSSWSVAASTASGLKNNWFVPVAKEEA